MKFYTTRPLILRKQYSGRRKAWATGNYPSYSRISFEEKSNEEEPQDYQQSGVSLQTRYYAYQSLFENFIT